MKHSIYMITCNNGKQYCGYTSRSPKTRLEEHMDNARKRKRRKSKLLNALRVHGLKSFEVLKTFKDEKEALLYERKIIKELNLMKLGLNMSPGGEGATMNLENPSEIRRAPRAYRKSKTRYTRRRRR